MKLHWFRTHKNLVYYIIIPGIIIGFVFYLPMGKGGGSFFGESGPSIQYTVGNKTYEISSADVLQKRHALFGFHGSYNPGGRDQYNRVDEMNPLSDVIGQIAAEDETARQLGFEIGAKEFAEILRNESIQKIRVLDREYVKEIVLTDDMYNKLLGQMGISSSQYKQIVHDLHLRTKFRNNIMYTLNESDSAVFPTFCERKEIVRFRYMVIKNDGFLAKVPEQKDEDIKAFYDNADNKKNPKYKDMFVHEPTLSAEAFFVKEDEQKFKNADKPKDAELQKTFEKYKEDKWKGKKFEEVKADVEKAWKEDDVKNFYDIRKTVFWEEQGKKGVYKPFETVKDDVEKQWRDDRVEKAKTDVQLRINTLQKDLSADVDKFKNDPANKDKEFNYDEWAKNHQLEHWVTKEHTQKEHQGGKNELKGEMLPAAASIFWWAESSPNMPADTLEDRKKHMDDWTSLWWLDQSKPELGGIFLRKKTYTEKKDKTLDEAKKQIVDHLKFQESLKLAEAEAKKLHDQWSKGEALPKLEDLEEITSDKKEHHPLVMKFKDDPKAVGEVLDVVNGMPERDPNSTVAPDPKDYERKWFYVGCAVERRLPTMPQFKAPKPPPPEKPDASQEPAFDRDRERNMARSYNALSAVYSMVDQIKMYRIGNMPDPDIRTVFRESHD